ncbi:Aromatic peroxygenase [Cercospora beticola]|uniref:Aromatic peroxygenase n=1 Tax=Cercospora beticola TaxID=122368 RepID=A0A2G5I2F4_CERBT|nr:Aromatic peroxygenase [Cercospora beticola]PIA98984.1 Aromatic peroxygenase [Cercospora beticola]WPB00622.1 hypothetical protein RHO25_005242 [Cercospora beticola]CAK1361154.1 unnamed protein product [Cercospora beticola]
MLFQLARLCLILSLTPILSTRFHAYAYPELVGLINDNRHSHAREQPAQFETKERTEEQQKLYARQLEVLTGLVDALAPGTLDAALSFGGGWSGFGSIDIGNGPIDVWGQFPFEPPGPYDQRGPCPGQNALANHHVISHTGIVSIWEVIEGTMAVFNLGYDIALLSVLAAVISGGDPVTMKYSLGGPDPRVGAPLDGLLGIFGTPQGLEHTHNFVECDSSMTRQDVYQYGNAWTMDVNLFLQFYESVPYGGLFTREAIVRASCVRWHQSKDWNPFFYYGPGTGYFRNFAQEVIMLFGNHSDGSIDGVLTHDILYSFYGLTSDPVPFTYREGWERIPENWYRRPVPFDFLGHITELLVWFGLCPELASIGGNTGTPNSFVGVNVNDPASGIANLPNLLEGTNLLCFLLQMLKFVSPSFTNNIYASIFGLVGDVTATLGCPEIPDLTRGGEALFANLQATYPGARMAESGF